MGGYKDSQKQPQTFIKRVVATILVCSLASIALLQLAWAKEKKITYESKDLKTNAFEKSKAIQNKKDSAEGIKNSYTIPGGKNQHNTK